MHICFNPKKGALNDDEKALLSSQNSAWGCDACQQACPITKNAIKNGTAYSEISFFKEHLIPSLKVDNIENMTKEEFSLRAYSWRGKETLLRNLRILENKQKTEEQK